MVPFGPGGGGGIEVSFIMIVGMSFEDVGRRSAVEPYAESPFRVSYTRCKIRLVVWKGSVVL